MGRLLSAVKRIPGLIYPAKCVSCGELLSDGGEVFCRTCYDSYENAKQEECSRCHKERCRCTCPSFSLGKAGLRRLIKLFRYQPAESDLPENRILYNLKQRHLKNVFDFFARELSESIDAALGEHEKATAILAPCPRSAGAKRKNGYDHTFLLCRAISKATGIPVFSGLKRKRGGKMQKRLSGDERRRNIVNRFFIKNGDELTGKTVILFDDVTTSGATLLECRRVVKVAGASRVIPCVIAYSGRDFVLRPQKTRKKGKKYLRPRRF